MKYKKIKQGYCPVCGAKLHNYEAIKMEGDQCCFPWRCEECGAKGEEWYNLEFAGHNVETETTFEELTVKPTAKEFYDKYLRGHSARTLYQILTMMYFTTIADDYFQPLAETIVDWYLKTDDTELETIAVRFDEVVAECSYQGEAVKLLASMTTDQFWRCYDGNTLKKISVDWDLDEKEVTIPGFLNEDEIAEFLSNATGHCLRGFVEED